MTRIELYHDYERALYNDKVLEKTSSDMAKTHQEREEKLKTLLIKNTLAIATLAFILFSINCTSWASTQSSCNFFLRV